MSQRAALLELERRKLSLLRNKVLEQEIRIKTLEQMDDDPFDLLLEQELAANTTPQEAVATQVQTPAQAPAAPSVAPESPPVVEVHARAHAAPSPFPTAPSAPPVFIWQKRPRRIPSTWVQLLRFIGLDGKDYEQVKRFIDANKLPISHGAARTQLMNYRRDFGFIENPRKGFYTTTEAALEYIRAQEGEANAIGDGEASESQPTPLTRAAA